jgi:O-antigen ligase
VRDPQTLRAADLAASEATAIQVGPLTILGRILLVAVIPLSLIWLPVGRIPGGGNVSAGDVAQVGLWVLSATALLVHGDAEMDVRAPVIAVLAVVIGLLAGVGAQLTFLDGKGLWFEAAMFMKRFGLAAIVPLASALFGSRSTGSWIRLASFVMICVLFAFTLDPSLQDSLPRPDDYDADVFASLGRATGSVTNPNDFAYASVSLFILHASFLPRRPRFWDRLVLVVALALAATCLASTGSRSGVVGAAGALAFVVLTSRIRIAVKMALVATAWIGVVIGLSYSSVFERRLQKAYHEGFNEENVYARVQMQVLAVKTAASHPYGVGYMNFSRATARDGAWLEYGTADSVYFDTLLGAGFVGLLALLALFRSAWMFVSRARPPDDPRGHFIKAGLVAFFLFGAATVVPISNFLAPLFFSLVGAAEHIDGADGDEESADEDDDAEAEVA